MGNKKYILPLLLLFIASLACTRTNPPVATATVRVQDTATTVPEPTATPFPTLTPVPTVIPAVQIENADQAYFNGDWQKALLDYTAAYEGEAETPKQMEINAAALLGIARTHYQMGDYDQSLVYLEQLLVSYSQSTLVGAAHFASAQVYESLGFFDQAAQAYSDYMQSRPRLIESQVLEWQGDALAAAGQVPTAIDRYQAAIASPRLGDTLPIELKIATAYAALGEYPTAVLAYQDIYTRTMDEYTKARLDVLIGQAYTAMGLMEDAYAAYLDAVENYPLSFDTYQALVTLVDAGYPVSEFDRGLIDYFAGQYSLAISAFDRYLADHSDKAGTAYYYKGLASRALDDFTAAIESWEVLIASFPEDDRWSDAWEEVAYTQWAYIDDFTAAVQTLLDFVANNPTHPRAPEFLFDAARIAERDRKYTQAADIWTRIPNEYPSSEYISQAIFLAGIAQYRVGEFNTALSTFEWALNSSAGLEKKAAAYFWLAKTYQALGDNSNAEVFWGNAANEDPTGYYSERARDLLAGRPAFDPPVLYDLVIDKVAEQEAAEAWMRTTFAINTEIDLSEPGPLANDLRLVRGTEFWNLGLYELARVEFESLRADIRLSAMDNYRLANYLVGLGLYRSAVFCAREVLSLNNMSDAETLNAPMHFNHLRFGSYYKELVIPTADKFGFHPLFLFSVLRQESLFEGFVRSSAGARGLMQIMPSTGESIAANVGWPPDYSTDDLYRPVVSINLGADYLATQRDYFDGDLYAALAAYNAGPGNTLVWLELANGDPDLFLEIIRFPETQDYIRGIYEVFSIYRSLYDRSP